MSHLGAPELQSLTITYDDDVLLDVLTATLNIFSGKCPDMTLYKYV